MEATMSTNAEDPIEFTRVRLKEIADMWATLARAKANVYAEKLPDAVRRLVSRPDPQVPTESPGEPGSAAAT
jgi:hypothetical protein